MWSGYTVPLGDAKPFAPALNGLHEFIGRSDQKVDTVQQLRRRGFPLGRNLLSNALC
jgi:hypothetical protein